MMRKVVGLITGFLLLAASLSCVGELKTPPNVAPQDLVDIRVMGTSIQRVPDYVTVITRSPDEEVNKLIEMGGQRLYWKSPDGEIHDSSVLFLGRAYAFLSPETMKNFVQGHEFEINDVIYYYEMGSLEEGQQFVRKYNLAKVVDIQVRGKYSTPLYRASPGYYVQVVVPIVVFTCSMHPHIAMEAPGDCPICKMELIPTERYQ